MPTYVPSKRDNSRASRKEWARAERKIKMWRRQELYILFLERIMAPYLGNIELTHYDRILASCAPLAMIHPGGLPPGAFAAMFRARV